MQFRKLNKQALAEYLNSEAFTNGEHIPITRHRALSQIKNPKAGDDDTLLILAEENGELMGYAGILPDEMQLNTGFIKVGWLSGLWVSEKARGKGVGQQLIKQAVNEQPYMLSGDYVPFTKKLYDRTDLFEKEPFQLNGIRFYIKSDLSNILPPKRKIFSQLKPVLKGVDGFVNLFLNKNSKKDSHLLSYSNHDFIDDEMNEFIQAHQATGHFQRQAVDYNWLLQNPWILSKPNKNAHNARYQFSSVEPLFTNHVFVSRNEFGKMNGLMIFSQRNRSLKLIACYHYNNLSQLANIICQCLANWKISTFTVFHAELVSELKQRKNLALKTRDFTRNYLISKALITRMGSIGLNLQDGDGDCGFT
ncbi:MAG: GNAT family N-acetyltransferase [Bacteroidetes bacterium]|nr:GNAT family N-acetyltransferase [Bacteroidota bacterium]